MKIIKNYGPGVAVAAVGFFVGMMVYQSGAGQRVRNTIYRALPSNLGNSGSAGSLGSTVSV